MNYQHFSKNYTIRHYQNLSITDKIFIKDFLLNANSPKHFFNSVCKEYRNKQLNFIEATERIVHYTIHLL
jgi:hypothetical protein